VVARQDITIGYIQDPTAPSSASAGQMQKGTSNLFPNSVQVTVRRDSSVAAGPLPLFFGGAIGTGTSNRTATATATLRNQGITGFKGNGCKLLPFALSQNAVSALLGSNQNNVPQGITRQDDYTVNRLTAGSAAGANVVKGSDGVAEIAIDRKNVSAKDFAAVALQSAHVDSADTYDAWVRSGPTSGDLSTFGLSGLQATAASPTTLYVRSSIPANLNSGLQTVLGQPRIMAVFESSASANASGNGNGNGNGEDNGNGNGNGNGENNGNGNGKNQGNTGNTGSPAVVGFVGVTLVSADLNGSKTIVLQLSPTVDATATLGPTTANNVCSFVYQSVSLSR